MTDDLKAAAAKFGNAEPVNHDWLDREEQRAQMAAAVSLPADQFLALIAVARNGLRPKLIGPAEELVRRAGKKPDCDCIQEINGVFVAACSCSNSGDAAETTFWCALMNASRAI